MESSFTIIAIFGVLICTMCTVLGCLSACWSIQKTRAQQEPVLPRRNMGIVNTTPGGGENGWGMTAVALHYGGTNMWDGVGCDTGGGGDCGGGDGGGGGGGGGGDGGGGGGGD